MFINRWLTISSWKNLKDFLEPEVESLDIDGQRTEVESPNNVQEREFIFEQRNNSGAGARYEAETEEGAVEVHVDEYPDVEMFGYDPVSDRFTMRTSNGMTEEYAYGSQEEGFIGAVGTPFGNEIWDLFYQVDGANLGGRNRASDRSGLTDISGSGVEEKLGLMAETKRQVSSYLADDQDSNIVLTSEYREDVERLPNGHRMDRGSSAIEDIETNLELGVGPSQAFKKRLTYTLHPFLQAVHGRTHRALFVEGYRFPDADDNKVYGLRLLNKRRDEQDELSRQIRRNNTFYDESMEYARDILRTDGII